MNKKPKKTIPPSFAPDEVAGVIRDNNPIPNCVRAAIFTEAFIAYLLSDSVYDAVKAARDEGLVYKVDRIDTDEIAHDAIDHAISALKDGRRQLSLCAEEFADDYVSKFKEHSNVRSLDELKEGAENEEEIYLD